MGQESQYEMEFIKGYTTCPKCGNAINYHNDAGDGFCLDFCKGNKMDKILKFIFEILVS